MKKWYNEEYEFTVEVVGFLRGDHTERYCRNGEEIGDKYTCTYGCPVNQEGYGICSKTMMMLYPLMEAVRSGGDLENLGGDGKYSKTIVCPDGCVMFRLTAKPLGNENFHKGGFWKEPFSIRHSTTASSTGILAREFAYRHSPQRYSGIDFLNKTLSFSAVSSASFAKQLPSRL